MSKDIIEQQAPDAAWQELLDRDTRAAQETAPTPHAATHEKAPEKNPEKESRPAKSDRPRSTFPTAGDMLALLGIYLLASLGGMLIAFFFGATFPYTEAGETIYPPDAVWSRTQCIVYIVTIGLTILLTLFYRHMRGGRGRLARFSARGLNPILLLWGVVLMLSTTVVIEPLVNIFRFMPLPEMTPGGWTVVMAVVAAPLLEEFLCRGVVLESLRARYGVVAAWLVSSFFFGVIHLHPALAVNAFVVGLIFAYIYIRSESLFPVIILHAFNNALALFLGWTRWPYEGPLAGKSMGELTVREMVGNEAVYAMIYLVALAIFIASAVMVGRTLRRMKAEEKIRTAE